MEICYIEHKNRNDNGTAWIAAIKRSNSGQTVYFNGKSFQKHHGVSGNYVDIETGEEYWISGVKKDGSDRHWAGSGKILIDKIILEEYLRFTNQPSLNSKKYEIIDIAEHNSANGKQL